MKLEARFVAPVDGPVIENGAVVVEDARITAVGSTGDFADTDVTDYGDAVICPGLVNAHTHLDLTGLAGLVLPSPDFTGWLRRLIYACNEHAHDRAAVQRAVHLGLEQSLHSGVTALGDITRHPQWTREVLFASRLRGVSFGEVIAIGCRRGLLSQRLDAATDCRQPTDRWCIGISPHAPYTVEPEAMRACARRAAELGAPQCIHLAETEEESSFTRSCAGPFVDFLRELGVWDDDITASGLDPVELAEKTGLLSSSTVVAHANYVTEADIRRLADTGASVAYCPRTHHAFGHPPHRFRDMRAASVNVCLGTDSLASNPSLSVLDEMRFLLGEVQGVSAADVLRMGTLHGARALGIADTAGSITVGKSADLVVIPLDTGCRDGWCNMLASNQLPCEVYIAGKAQLA